MKVSIAAPTRILRKLRNTRDLRAEALSLAAELAAAGGRDQGRMLVVQPVIAEATVRKEWEALLPAIARDVRDRMHLEIESSKPKSASGLVALAKPNYRYEVLRLLIEANLRDERMSVKQMIGLIEASQTPVRAALDGLRSAGVVQEKGTALHLRVADITTDLLAKADALPDTLRFRFEQGAQIKPSAHLLQRCLPLLEVSADNTGWGRMALSGVATAIKDLPALDVIGLPRLDLVVQVPHRVMKFDAGLLKQLDDGLERECSVLKTAPVVVTIVRAKLMRARNPGQVSMALPSDVFLSLLDIGLREQAMQYASSTRSRAA